MVVRGAVAPGGRSADSDTGGAQAGRAGDSRPPAARIGAPPDVPPLIIRNSPVRNHLLASNNQRVFIRDTSGTGKYCPVSGIAVILASPTAVTGVECRMWDRQCNIVAQRVIS